MTQLSIPVAIQAALVHHQSGRLNEAETLYRQVLQQDPNCADALHLLGVLAHQVKRDDVSVDLIQRAIQLNQSHPAFYGNLGVTLEAMGRVDEAINCWRHALAMQPNYVEALNNLARVLDSRGKTDEAVNYWMQVITIRPDFPDVYNNLAVVRVRQKRMDEAIGLFRQAIERNPRYVDALQNLATLLFDQKKFDEAKSLYRRAFEANPQFVRALVGLADVARAEKRFDESRAELERAQKLDPNCADVYHSMGLLLREQGLLRDSESWFRQAVARNPQSAEWTSNLGTAIQELSRLDEALTWLDRCIAMMPDHPGLHFNRSLILLLLGRLPEGWEEYTYRVKCPQFAYLHRRFTQPAWEGQELKNRRIYLHAEQGFGDAIHFVRYAPLVAARGGKIILECQPALVRLLSSAPSVTEVVGKGDPLPAIDYQVSLLDLPRIFDTRLDNVPAKVPYLFPEQAAVDKWKKILDDACPPDGRPRVGIAWAGNPANSSEWKRTMRLAQFAPFVAADVNFISLQKGDGAPQAKEPPEGMKLIDLTEQITDFVDTAALMQHLDLIVSVDTSVVHLAGALAQPVWTMLPSCPDWRWMMDRSDTPWYPTMKLFRQTALGEWDEVIERVARELLTWRAAWSNGKKP